MNQPLDMYFGPQSERILIDFVTLEGYGGSDVSIEVEADPNTYVRVSWGDAPAKICQHYTQSLQLTHSYPSYNQGGGMRFTLCIELEEGAHFIGLKMKERMMYLDTSRLDLSHCPHLRYLQSQKVEELHLPTRSMLTDLKLREYRGTHLDLSGAYDLETFACTYCGALQQIDLSHSAKLYALDVCYSVHLHTIKLPNRCNLSELKYNVLALKPTTLEYLRTILRSNKGEEVIEIFLSHRAPGADPDLRAHKDWYEQLVQQKVRRIKYDSGGARITTVEDALYTKW